MTFWKTDDSLTHKSFIFKENGSREHLKIAQQYFQLVCDIRFNSIRNQRYVSVSQLYLFVIFFCGIVIENVQVGGSASECDTIPGRQCMAACFFLLKQFDDVLLYLNRWNWLSQTTSIILGFSLTPRSIKSYYYNDDVFNFDYGQAKAAVGNYQVWGFLRREQWSEVLYCWFHLMFLN